MVIVTGFTAEPDRRNSHAFRGATTRSHGPPEGLSTPAFGAVIVISASTDYYHGLLACRDRRRSTVWGPPAQQAWRLSLRPRATLAAECIACVLCCPHRYSPTRLRPRLWPFWPLYRVRHPEPHQSWLALGFQLQPEGYVFSPCSSSKLFLRLSPVRLDEDFVLLAGLGCISSFIHRLATAYEKLYHG